MVEWRSHSDVQRVSISQLTAGRLRRCGFRGREGQGTAKELRARCFGLVRSVLIVLRRCFSFRVYMRDVKLSLKSRWAIQRAWMRASHRYVYLQIPAPPRSEPSVTSKYQVFHVISLVLV